MHARRSRLPKGSRTAARIVRLLGAWGTVTLLMVCLVISFCAIGAKYVSTATGDTACQLPGRQGGAGVEVFGDTALTGLAKALPATLARGEVIENVKAHRTAQQGESDINALPDSAPATFIVSLEADDSSDPASYTARIDELMLLLSGRTVFWISMPGKDAYTKIVNTENAPDRTDPQAQAGWQILDFAASVAQHSDWWSGATPSNAGLRSLASTLTAQINSGAGGSGGASTGSGAPRGITVTSTVTASGSFPLDAERTGDARTIVSVGTGMGVPQRGQVIAVATAIQESKLINLHGGLAGAYGLFQQTPPYWGTVAEVTDPAHAATSFYQHLQKVAGWQNMALTDAAQAVQQSGYPDAYAQWEQSATVIVAALAGQHATGCGPQVSVPGNPKAQLAVTAALSQLGVPYSFAAGNAQGPTLGQCMAGTDGYNDCHIVGFDCSGLMLYAWAKAGVTVPHFTGAMWTDPTFTHITDESQLQPGDMMMFEGSPPGHTGMYVGNGKLVDAPHSGAVVEIKSLDDPWYKSGYVGALRPKV